MGKLNLGVMNRYPVPPSIERMPATVLDALLDAYREERDMLNDDQEIYMSQNFGLEHDRTRYDQACIAEAINAIVAELARRGIEE